MLSYPLQLALRHLSRGLDDSVAGSDRHLLERFVTVHDQAAFAELVRRHAPLVWGTCTRLLGNSADAEDVFQGVFLVLIHKAGSVRWQSSIGNYLYGVAHRLALKSRVAAARRRTHEQRAGQRPRAEPEAARRELCAALDAELQRLPERYRTPLVLRYLDGQTREETARQLGCSVSTLLRRLERGIELLAVRLRRQGFTLSAALLAAGLANEARGRAPAHLAANLARTASAMGGSATRPAVLAAEFIRSVTLARLRFVAVLVLALGATTAAGLFAWRVAPGGPSPVVDTPPTETTPAADPQRSPQMSQVRRDALGDPLPDGAVARLGTLRFRHGDGVRSLGFSSDGKTLLSADWHVAHVWDTATGRRLRSFGDPRSQQFQSSSFSRDGTLAVLTMDNGDVEIWDTRTGQRLRQFRAGRFPSATFSPDNKLLLVHDYDGHHHDALRLWSGTTGIQLQELRGHQDQIHHAGFSNDGKTIVSASEDKTIRFWDVATGNETRRLQFPEPVLRLAVTPDARTLALVHGKKMVNETPNSKSIGWVADSEVILWDVAGGKMIRRVKAQEKNPSVNMFFSPDGQTLWTSDFQTVRSWSMRSGEQIGQLSLETAFVTLMTFSQDGKTFATGGADQVVRVWDTATLRQKSPTGGHHGPIQAVAISPDGCTFATAGADATIRLWDRASGQERRQLVGQGRAISTLAFTPDGTGLLSTGSPSFDETVRLWNVATGKEVRHFAGISSVCSADGKVLFTRTKDQIVHVWELATGKELRRWPAPLRDRFFLHLSLDGRTLMSWSEDRVVRLRDTASGKEQRRFAGPSFDEDSHHRVYAVAVSPDGRYLAFGGQVNYLVVYDVGTGKEVRRFGDGIPGAVSALAFSADNRFLACGDWSTGTLRLFELASAQQIQQRAGHQGRIFNMAFSKDGSVLITGDQDTTALVWDLTGQASGEVKIGAALSDADLDTCWQDLAGTDAVRAQRAVRQLAAAPTQTVAYLNRRLQPVAAVDEQRLTRLIADLDSDEFSVRDQAAAELEKLGEAATGACRRTLDKQPSAEVRSRLEALLTKQRDLWFGKSQEHLRVLRALEALEFAGTPAARQVLERLARGAPGATLTSEASAALARMRR